MQLLSEQVQARRVYTHLGWRQLGDAWCYLHAGGALGAQGAVPDVAVAPSPALARYQLPAPPAPAPEREAIRASLQLLEVAPDTVVLPLYAAIWRAVLGGTDFSMHLVGPTGVGKSALAALAQQHYGPGMMARHLPAAWISTGNALEELAFQAKDALLTVDDFCPGGAPTDIHRAHRDAERLLRAQGNQSGRQRLRPDGTLRPVKPPRGLVLSTGEEIPHGPSLRARLLIVDVAPGQVHWARLTACQADAAAGRYAQALAGFVRWLAPRYGEVVQAVPVELGVLRQQAVQAAHRRTPEILAHLALGWRYFLAYAQAREALTAEDASALWQRGWTALGDVAAMQQEHQASEDPVGRFLALVAAALTAGQAHVADAATLQEPYAPTPALWGWRARPGGPADGARPAWQPWGDCIGWVAEGRLYLEPEAAFGVAQQLARAQGIPLAVTPKTLWRRLAERGLLIRDPGGQQNTIRRTIGPAKKRQRVIDIAVDLLSAEISPFSPRAEKAQQNNGLESGLVDCLAASGVPDQATDQASPPWAPSCPLDAPLPQEPPPPPSPAARGSDAPPGTAVGTAAWSAAWTEHATRSVRNLGPQPLENQGAGLQGLEGLKSRAARGSPSESARASSAPPRAACFTDRARAPTDTCPHCGGAQWRFGVTTRTCTACGYRHGPGVAPDAAGGP